MIPIEGEMTIPNIGSLVPGTHGGDINIQTRLVWAYERCCCFDFQAATFGNKTIGSRQLPCRGVQEVKSNEDRDAFFAWIWAHPSVYQKKPTKHPPDFDPWKSETCPSGWCQSSWNPRRLKQLFSPWHVSCCLFQSGHQLLQELGFQSCKREAGTWKAGIPGHGQRFVFDLRVLSWVGHVWWWHYLCSRGLLQVSKYSVGSR